MGCKMMPIVSPAFSVSLALTIDSCKRPRPPPPPQQQPDSAIRLSPSNCVMLPDEMRIMGGKVLPPFFSVAPDVTRFGQEIGSIIVAVVIVVIGVIADLQQKTAGPKIELQTVKKGGEERRGEERKEVIRSSAEVAWMAATAAAGYGTDKKAKNLGWGNVRAEHLDATR